MDYSPFYCKNFYKERRKKAEGSKTETNIINVPDKVCAPSDASVIPDTVITPASSPAVEEITYKTFPKYKQPKGNRKKRKGFFVALLVLLCFSIVMLSADLISGGSVLNELRTTFGSDYVGKHYFVINGEYSTKSTAEAEALAARDSGGAGYIYNTNKSYYVVIASYADKKSAETVKNKNKGFQIIEVTMREPAKTGLNDSQKKLCDKVLKLILDDIDTIYSIIDQVSRGTKTQQQAFSELTDMRNTILLAKDELINAGLPIEIRNSHLNIIDPLFGGLDAIVYKEIGPYFLAEIRYVLAGSIVSFT